MVLLAKIAWLGLNWLHKVGVSLVALAGLAMGMVLLRIETYAYRGYLNIRQRVTDSCLRRKIPGPKAKTTKTKKKQTMPETEHDVQALIETVNNQVTIGKTKPVAQHGPIATVVDKKTGYIKPHSSMLNQACPSGQSRIQAGLAKTGQVLQSKLMDFNVQSSDQCSSWSCGDRYEFQPAPGVRASKITSLSSDIARSLTKTSVRVVEVIPGKTTIGIEIPNTKGDGVFKRSH